MWLGEDIWFFKIWIDEWVYVEEGLIEMYGVVLLLMQVESDGGFEDVEVCQ